MPTQHTTARTDPDLLAVVRGDRAADLLLRGGRVVNVFTRTIDEADVAIFRGRVASVGPPIDADRVVHLDGRVIAPGLIDAHMHLESTMMLPRHFASVAVPRGTTGVVADPHEIANVAGLEGIRFLLDECRTLALKVWFTASSCVPASPLESSGARLEADDLAPLLAHPRVVALAEMMNFPGVVDGDPGVLAKLAMAREHGPIDGHCPGLGGRALQAYVASGIGSDHECTSADEAAEKLALGMRIFLREGSAARNLEALVGLVEPANAHRFCFCTDDRHPADLIDEGHLDHVVRRAVALGMDPVTAIAIASLHPAEHYGLHDVGAVAPGRIADLVVLDGLRDLCAQQVYIDGVLVAEDGRSLVHDPASARTISRVPEALRDTVRVPAGFDAGSLRVPCPATDGGLTIRVIEMHPHQLVTGELHLPATVDARCIVANVESDVLKLAAIERHAGAGGVGIGFVRGFGLQAGAMASTVGHDAHNITVVGVDDADMAAAVAALADAGGGQCVVRDGSVLAILPLPIAGLLSAEPAETLVRQQAELHRAAASIGCTVDDPFMPLSFLSLTVIPKLKLSDLGLVDAAQGAFVPLVVGGATA